MKNKLGTASLITSLVFLIFLYSVYDFIPMEYSSSPIFVYIFYLLVVLFFAGSIILSVLALRDKEEFKGYPILSLIIILPFLLIAVWGIVSTILWTFWAAKSPLFELIY